MDRAEIAWAAGIVDGEGTIYTTKSTTRRKNKAYHRWSVRLYIGQSPNAGQIPEMLLRLRRLFGGSINGPHTRKQSGPICTYQLTGYESVQRALAMIWPWLCPPKRQQAHAAMMKWLHASPRYWNEVCQ